MLKRISLFLFLMISASWAFGQIILEDVDYTSNTFSDLTFLKEEIGDKSIVCLGEEWHFTETFSQVKNRMVKYLHQEMGFDIILFEASFQGAWIAEKNGLKGKERLMETLPTIWRTESVLDLMNYIDASKTSSAPMTQYGIDLNGVYTKQFAKELETYLRSKAVYNTDELLRIERIIQEDWIEEHSGKLFTKTRLKQQDIESYELLLKFIEQDDSFENQAAKLLLLRCISNRVELARKLMTKDKWFRERIMADNLEWILNTVGKNKKVIIWAADIHISKSQQKTVKDGKESMIELLPEEFQNEVYSLSLIPIQRTPKKLNKQLSLEAERFFFYNLDEENALKYRGEEFDGMIVCKRPESIANFRVE